MPIVPRPTSSAAVQLDAQSPYAIGKKDNLGSALTKLAKSTADAVKLTKKKSVAYSQQHLKTAKFISDTTSEIERNGGTAADVRANYKNMYKKAEEAGQGLKGPDLIKYNNYLAQQIQNSGKKMTDTANAADITYSQENSKTLIAQAKESDAPDKHKYLFDKLVGQGVDVTVARTTVLEGLGLEVEDALASGNIPKARGVVANSGNFLTSQEIATLNIKINKGQYEARNNANNALINEVTAQGSVQKTNAIGVNRALNDLLTGESNQKATDEARALVEKEHSLGNLSEEAYRKSMSMINGGHHQKEHPNFLFNLGKLIDVLPNTNSKQKFLTTLVTIGDISGKQAEGILSKSVKRRDKMNQQSAGERAIFINNLMRAAASLTSSILEKSSSAVKLSGANAGSIEGEETGAGDVTEYLLTLQTSTRALQSFQNGVKAFEKALQEGKSMKQAALEGSVAANIVDSPYTNNPTLIKVSKTFSVLTSGDGTYSSKKRLVNTLRNTARKTAVKAKKYFNKLSHLPEFWKYSEFDNLKAFNKKINSPEFLKTKKDIGNKGLVAPHAAQLINFLTKTANKGSDYPKKLGISPYSFAIMRDYGKLANSTASEYYTGVNYLKEFGKDVTVNNKKIRKR